MPACAPRSRWSASPHTPTYDWYQSHFPVICLPCTPRGFRPDPFFYCCLSRGLRLCPPLTPACLTEHSSRLPRQFPPGSSFWRGAASACSFYLRCLWPYRYWRYRCLPAPRRAQSDIRAVAVIAAWHPSHKNLLCSLGCDMLLSSFYG